MDYKGIYSDMRESEIVTSLDGLLDESVRLRMIADVELEWWDR